MVGLTSTRGERGEHLGRHVNVMEVAPTSCLGNRHETPQAPSQEAMHLDESVRVWVGLGGLCGGEKVIERAVRWIRGNGSSHSFRPGHEHLILAGAGKEEALGEAMKSNTWGARHREVAQLRRTVEPNQAAQGVRIDGRSRPRQRGWQQSAGGRTGGSIGHASEGARTAHRRPAEWRCRVGVLGRSDCR